MGKRFLDKTSQYGREPDLCGSKCIIKGTVLLAEILSIAMLLMSSSGGVMASPEGMPPIGVRPGCGDYRIVSNRSIRDQLEKHCGTSNENDHIELLAALKHLDPSKEALASAQRGDFRLAAIVRGGPPAPDNERNWIAAGVTCGSLEQMNVVVFVFATDALGSRSQAEVQRRMSRYVVAYNSELITQPGFPEQLHCHSGNHPQQ